MYTALDTYLMLLYGECWGTSGNCTQHFLFVFGALEAEGLAFPPLCGLAFENSREGKGGLWDA